MTVKELIEQYKNKVADIEVYHFFDDDKRIHDDTLNPIWEQDDVNDITVKRFELMDEETYENTILANTSIVANFEEWYDDRSAVVLIIIIDKEEYLAHCEEYRQQVDCDENKIICIDIETTGLDEYDEILQISIVDYKGNKLFNEYIRPTKNDCWEEAMAIHGITPEMIQDKKTISEHKAELEKIINSAELIVTFNGDYFDLPFLKREGINIDNNIATYDVMLDFAKIYKEWNSERGEYKWKSLNFCTEFFNITNENAHDSLSDTRATMQCFHKLRAIHENREQCVNAHNHFERDKIINFINQNEHKREPALLRR